MYECGYPRTSTSTIISCYTLLQAGYCASIRCHRTRVFHLALTLTSWCAQVRMEEIEEHKIQTWRGELSSPLLACPLSSSRLPLSVSCISISISIIPIPSFPFPFRPCHCRCRCRSVAVDASDVALALLRSRDWVCVTFGAVQTRWRATSRSSRSRRTSRCWRQCACWSRTACTGCRSSTAPPATCSTSSRTSASSSSSSSTCATPPRFIPPPPPPPPPTLTRLPTCNSPTYAGSSRLRGHLYRVHISISPVPSDFSCSRSLTQSAGSSWFSISTLRAAFRYRFEHLVFQLHISFVSS